MVKPGCKHAASNSTRCQSAGYIPSPRLFLGAGRCPGRVITSFIGSVNRAIVVWAVAYREGVACGGHGGFQLWHLKGVDGIRNEAHATGRVPRKGLEDLCLRGDYTSRTATKSVEKRMCDPLQLRIWFPNLSKRAHRWRD